MVDSFPPSCASFREAPSTVGPIAEDWEPHQAGEQRLVRDCTKKHFSKRHRFHHEPRMFSCIYLFYNILCLYICMLGGDTNLAYWACALERAGVWACRGDLSGIKRTLCIDGNEKSIHANENGGQWGGVGGGCGRGYCQYSVYITDLVIFTITFKNSAYWYSMFSMFRDTKKNHAIAFKINHLINYFLTKCNEPEFI